MSLLPAPCARAPARVLAAALGLGAVLATAAAPLAAQAATAPVAAVAVGQSLPPLNLTDQHDKPWTIPADTRLVLFAAGRKPSNLVQAVLQPQPSGFLASRKAVYLADLSKMPGFATRMFALPALREMPFQVGIALNEATLAAWPRQPEQVTLLHLERGVVQSIQYASTEAELRSALSL